MHQAGANFGKRGNEMRSRIFLKVICCVALAMAAVGSSDWAFAVDPVPESPPVTFDIGPQPLATALNAFAVQSHQTILFTPEIAAGKMSPGVKGRASPSVALAQILSGTGLVSSRSPDGIIMIAAADAKGASATSDPPFAPNGAAEDQTQNRPATQPGSTRQSLSLEEIIVTATRREESVEKVPISIHALSQNDLTQAHIQDISDIAAVTPGLLFAGFNGFASTNTSISIRGMNVVTGASVVGLYVDDTPIQTRIVGIGNVGNPYPVLFDLNRVEVDRGPQGTLFGAGSEAGTVRFITNQPSLTTFSGSSHAELASTEHGGLSYEIGAAAGGPIVEDKVGFRVSVWDRHDGGYVNLIDPISGSITSSDVNTDEKLAVKGALTFKAGDAVLVTPSLFYQSIHTGDSGRFYAQFSNPSQGLFNDGTLLPEHWSDRFTLPSVKVEAQLPFAELTSITSYMDRTVWLVNDTSAFLSAIGLVNYGSPLGPGYPSSTADVAPQLTGQSVNRITQEIRLASNKPDAFLTWVAGAFFDRSDQKDYATYYSLLLDPTGANIGNLHQETIDKQLAVYAQGDFHISSQWTVTLGARISDVNVDQRNNNGTGVLNTGQPAVQYATSTESPFTPKASVSYQADRNNLLYASAGKGFRAGGGNPAVPSVCNTTFANEYHSDEIWSYEVGAKDTLFDGRVQIDTSAFRLNWSKIQQQLQLQCGFSYITNVGNAISKGFDLAMQAIVTDQLRVNLDVGYANAYFNSNISEPGGQPVVLAGDKVGTPPLVSPPWDVNSAVSYEIPLAHGDKIHLRGEYQYHSRNPGPFITQIAASPNYFPLNVADPPTHLFNARIGILTMDRVDVTAFVENVFDSHPVLGAYQWSATSNLVTDNTLRPRTVGVSVNVDF
jgi:iron complex outermembrane receptor protein